MLRCSAGIVAVEVTSMPPIRSSAIAWRIKPDSASGSSPASSRCRRVTSDSGWKTNIAAVYDAARNWSDAGRGSRDVDRAGGVERYVEMRAPRVAPLGEVSATMTAATLGAGLRCGHDCGGDGQQVGALP